MGRSVRWDRGPPPALPSSRGPAPTRSRPWGRRSRSRGHARSSSGAPRAGERPGRTGRRRTSGPRSTARDTTDSERSHEHHRYGEDLLQHPPRQAPSESVSSTLRAIGKSAASTLGPPRPLTARGAPVPRRPGPGAGSSPVTASRAGRHPGCPRIAAHPVGEEAQGQHAPKSVVAELMRVDWATVGRMIERVVERRWARRPTPWKACGAARLKRAPARAPGHLLADHPQLGQLTRLTSARSSNRSRCRQSSGRGRRPPAHPVVTPHRRPRDAPGAATGSYVLGFALLDATAVLCLAVLRIMSGPPRVRAPRETVAGAERPYGVIAPPRT